MNMLLTAVLVCLAMCATAEPDKQTLQQLMEEKLSEVHHEMRMEMNILKEANEKLNLEIAELRKDHRDSVRTREYLTSQLYEDQSQLKSQVVEVERRLTDTNSLFRGGSSGERFSFLAELTTVVEQGNFVIVFDQEHYNRGGAYNPATGLYTVPVDGIYVFTAHIFLKDHQPTAFLFLQVDGVDMGYAESSEPAYRSDLWSTMRYTLQLQLHAKQTVNVRAQGVVKVYGSTEAYVQTYFSGHLIET